MGGVRSSLILFVPGVSLIRTYLIPSTAAYHTVYGCGYGVSPDWFTHRFFAVCRSFGSVSEGAWNELQ